MDRPKLYGNCAFPQTFYTRILGEITVFYAVINRVIDQQSTISVSYQKLIATSNILYRKATLFKYFNEQCPKLVKHTLKILQKMLQDF